MYHSSSNKSSLLPNSMDHYTRTHIPAFGSWDYYEDLPFTQCFESARQAGLIPYSYNGDRDHYVAGDLYENNIVTPAIIVAPRRRGYHKEAKKGAWVAYDCKQPSPPQPPRARSRYVNPKAVDEDLYKISPELLRANRTKGVRCFPRAKGVHTSDKIHGQIYIPEIN